MNDIEIVVFQDKSWVRLTEYQKAKEECEQLQQKWLESEYEKSKLVSQIEKMKCCMNCKGYDTTLDGAVTCNKFRFYDCKSNITLNNENCIDYWELAE